jgi:hypothetical protein
MLRIDTTSIINESETASSLASPNALNKKIKTASLVPLPEMEIGIKANKDEMETLKHICKYDIFMFSSLAKKISESNTTSRQLGKKRY